MSVEKLTAEPALPCLAQLLEFDAGLDEMTLMLSVDDTDIHIVAG